MKQIIKTQFFSYKTGELPKGCKQCVEGEKLVLYATGICNRTCFYCPLSEERKDKDVLYANEWNTELNNKELTKKQLDIIFKEAELCNAKGAGITGGDPLLVWKRTSEIIKNLKQKFGKNFHIHLYTSLNNINEERLESLHKAGLDEIRFHPEFDNRKFWDRISIAQKYDWRIGIEIPSIPEYEKETMDMLEYFNGKISFVNINELEISDTNSQKLIERGYRTKSKLSYGVAGSEEMALRLMKFSLESNFSFKVHYCTCKLKDKIQLTNRIKRRAKNIANKFDIITKDGTIIRGAIYTPDLFPSFSYRKKLSALSLEEKSIIATKIEQIRKGLIANLNAKSTDLVLDVDKLRIIAGKDFVIKNKSFLKENNLLPAIVEEYPTQDAIEVEIEAI